MLLALGFLLTLLNAFKPLHIDDTAYHYYAAHIAKDPWHPYSFDVFWYDHPEPANEVLAPPVVPYWWSLAIRLFGERPFLWKLWMLPFNLLFVFSLHALCRRFARGLETPLVVMTALSPTFLPGINLMLDVPALALSLGAVALCLHTCERGCMALVLLAGLTAGLGMQTKYTAFLAPVTMLLAALFFGRLRDAVLAVVIPTLVFVAGELLIAHSCGASHFLYHFRESRRTLWESTLQTYPLLADVGGTVPTLALLGLGALRVQGKNIAFLGGAFLFGYVLLAGIPDFRDPADGEEGYAWRAVGYSDRLHVADIIFGILGVAVWGTVLAVLWRLCRIGRVASWLPRCGVVSTRCGVVSRPRRDRHRREWFLALWLLLEVAGYFALTPFPAVRRVMGVVVVATLLTGRLASLSCRVKARKAIVQGVALGAVLLGLGFYWVDLLEASAQKTAADEAARISRDPQGSGSANAIWYVGHWGFQYYAERAGMIPVVPGESRLHQGDWLVVPDRRLEQQKIDIDKNLAQILGPLTVEDHLPLRTVVCYYGSRTPLEHKEGPRFRVTIYRVKADFVPRPPPSSSP